jgi:hypothetical protein
MSLTRRFTVIGMPHVSKSLGNPATSVDNPTLRTTPAEAPEAGAPPLGAGYWRGRRLAELSTVEWEALCDGCAKCCLLKLEDARTGRVHYTNVRCRLLDPQTCRCTDYARRSTLVPDCMTLTPDNLAEATWLPQTCAYRRLAEGFDLPHWHPLVSGDPLSVVRAGRGICGRTVAEEDAGNLEHHIVTWVR